MRGGIRALAGVIPRLDRVVVEDADPQHDYTKLLLSSIPNPFAEGIAAD